MIMAGEEVRVKLNGSLETIGRAVNTLEKSGLGAVLHVVDVFAQAPHQLCCLVGGIENLCSEGQPEIVGCLKSIRTKPVLIIDYLHIHEIYLHLNRLIDTSIRRRLVLGQA